MVKSPLDLARCGSMRLDVAGYASICVNTPRYPLARCFPPANRLVGFPPALFLPDNPAFDAFGALQALQGFSRVAESRWFSFPRRWFFLSRASGACPPGASSTNGGAFGASRRSRRANNAAPCREDRARLMKIRAETGRCPGGAPRPVGIERSSTRWLSL